MHLSKRDNLPKLTVMLKYLVTSVTCLESANDPVRKLSTDPAPFACKKHNFGINNILRNKIEGQWIMRTTIKQFLLL